MLARWYREISTTSLALCLSRTSRGRESNLQTCRADEKDAGHNRGVENEEDLSDGEAMMDQDSETGTRSKLRVYTQSIVVDMPAEDEVDMDILDSGEEDNNLNQVGYVIGL